MSFRVRVRSGARATRLTKFSLVSVFAKLVSDGMSSHNAWRTAFAIVPVPLLLTVATLTLVFGTDCPAGKWETRHTLPASAVAAKHGHFAQLDASEKRVVESKMAEKEQARTTVQEAEEDEDEASTCFACSRCSTVADVRAQRLPPTSTSP